MRAVVVGTLLALLFSAAPATAATQGGAGQGVSDRVTRAAGSARGGVPALTVSRQVRGLSNPWDVQSIGNGRLLVTERDTARLLLAGPGGKRQVLFPSGSVWVSGETGLMGLEVDPGFRRNRRIYTCQGGYLAGGRHDVRVVAWRLNRQLTAVRRIRTLVGGIPATSGRHGGCRLLILRDGSMLVGTGDAAVGTNPRNLRSLGGKTLRLNRFTGRPWPTNPFIGADNRRRRYVHTYGHRNVQGLAQRSDGTLWSVEHGPDRDDEINLLVNGGDYGWNPVPGYNESVPMTDFSLPGRQIGARWRSGFPTLAISGARFVRGDQWGALDGTLAVAALKASRMIFMRFDARGRLVRTWAPSVLRQFGRLRSVSRAPNGDLLVTTDEGAGEGAVLRVHPK